MKTPGKHVDTPYEQRWVRYLVRRDLRTRTTWMLRVAVFVCMALGLWLIRAPLSATIARGLVCREDMSASDALLLENFDSDYLIFERAAALRGAGIAKRALVPLANRNAVSIGVLELFARLARLDAPEIVPIPEVEPISLNAAYAIRDFLEGEHIRTVTVVTPLFRSRRSELIYDAVLGATGIAVRCAPVRGDRDQKDWTRTWHGVQEVVIQWVKLLYYRLYVMPFLFSPNAPSRS